MESKIFSTKSLPEGLWFFIEEIQPPANECFYVATEHDYYVYVGYIDQDTQLRRTFDGELIKGSKYWQPIKMPAHPITPKNS